MVNKIAALVILIVTFNAVPVTAELAANSVTAEKIVAGTITAAQIAAGTITATQIAAGTITAAQIAASTITATQIAGGTITADRLNVSTLSAITANLGNMTAGQIVVGSSNKLWMNDAGDGVLAIGGSTKGSAPFYVTSAGELTAVNLKALNGLRVEGGVSYIATLDVLVRVLGQVDPANPSVKGGTSSYLCVDASGFMFACQ